MVQWLAALAGAVLEDPSFESQHPHGASQSPVSTVPGDPRPSGLCGYQVMYIIHRQHVGKILIHIK